MGRVSLCSLGVMCLLYSCTGQTDKNEVVNAQGINMQEIEQFVTQNVLTRDTALLRQSFDSTAWHIVDYYYERNGIFNFASLHSFFEYMLAEGTLEEGQVNGEPCTCLNRTTYSKGVEIASTNICFQKQGKHLKVIYLNHGK